jgi:hypothetical protein
MGYQKEGEMMKLKLDTAEKTPAGAPRGTPGAMAKVMAAAGMILTGGQDLIKLPALVSVAFTA